MMVDLKRKSFAMMSAITDGWSLFDSVTGKLKGWEGKLINRKGRLTLINSVIRATVTYFLTAFPADNGMIKKLDKLRRQFL